MAVNKENNEIVGHILISKIIIRNDNHAAETLALAPVSVLPDYQNKGIGKLLILEALAETKKLGYHFVIVLGHSEYYSKFGFKKASLWGIEAPFEVPDEALMVLELYENALDKILGIIEYPNVFFE